MRETVLSEVLALQKLSLVDLRRKYTELFPHDKGVRGNRLYFERRVTYRLQEQAYGGLSDTAQAHLQKLSSETHRNLATVRDPLQVSEQATAALRRLQRRGAFLPGTILTKVYKGQTLQVRVVEKGFEYQGTLYRSLSAIAHAITGAHWNGRAFFGL